MLFEGMANVLSLVDYSVGSIESVEGSLTHRLTMQVTVHIRLLLIFLNRGVDKRFRVGHSCICHEDIQPPKVFDNVVDRLLNPGWVRYFQLVCFHSDAMLLC